jgi:prevent-host-death family protein
MKSIGVRELRQRASEHLKEVAQGRTLEVTDRGRPVARLVPALVSSRRELLASRGRLTPEEGDVLALGAPLAPAQGTRSPSDRLADARANER